MSCRLAELNAFNTTLCGTVIGAIGKYKLPNLGRPDLIKLKNYALTCSVRRYPSIDNWLVLINRRGSRG